MLFSKKIIILPLFLFFVFPQISHASWACGDALVDSRDSKTYTTVQIGAQCWMKQNLNVGTKITSCTGGYVGDCAVGGDTAQDQGTSCVSIQKYCYSDNEANCTTDGGLYQWNQAMCGSTTEGVQGICPAGWHIPTDAEYKILVEGQATAGCESSTGWQCSPAGSHLSDYTLNHDNSSGFSGLLAGQRDTDGAFYGRTSYTNFLPSTQSDVNTWRRNLDSGFDSVYRGTVTKARGFSLRCLQDPNTAPTLTSISDSPDPIEGGETITITPTGQADTDSDALYYYCNETGSATSADTLCTQANTSTASPYTGMTCSYPVSTGNTTRTVYCRAYDGTGYSTERTTTYAVVTANIPTTLEASYTPGVNTITTTWSANSNPTGTEYYIENTIAGTNSGWTTATTYTFTGLNCNTLYLFKVKSRDSTAVAESVYTDSISRVITCPGGGGAPSSFSFSPPPTPTPTVISTPTSAPETTPVSPQQSPAPTTQLKQKLIELITQLIQMLMAQVTEMRG